MVQFTDADKGNNLELLKECLAKTKVCDVVVTLKQFLKKNDGEYNNVDVDHALCVSKNEIFIKEGLVYLTMQTDVVSKSRIKTFWKQMLKENTDKELAGQPINTALIIDLIKSELENNTVYTISLMNPVFLSLEEEEMLMVFGPNYMSYGVDEVGLEDIEYDSSLTDEKDEETENSELLDNEEYLNGEEFLEDYEN